MSPSLAPGEAGSSGQCRRPESWEPLMGRGSGHGVSLLQRLMSCRRSQSAHGCGLLPWEAFWTFREPVRIPDYGEEGSFSSGGRTLALSWPVRGEAGQHGRSGVCARGPPRTMCHPPRAVLSLALRTRWDPSPLLAGPLLTAPTALDCQCKWFKFKRVHCECQHTVGGRVVKGMGEWMILHALTCGLA